MLTDKIMKSSPNTRIFVSVSIAAIVAMCSYNWVVSPQTSYLHAAQQYEKMMSNSGQKSEVIKNRIDQKKTELIKLNEEISATWDSFFTEEKAREFFSDLEPLAFQSNCTIESLTFMPVEKISSGTDQTRFTGISLRRATVSLLGWYENVIKFLAKLSSYSQRISISDLTIESTYYDRKELVCYMTITIYLIEDEDKEIIPNEKN